MNYFAGTQACPCITAPLANCRVGFIIIRNILDSSAQHRGVYEKWADFDRDARFPAKKSTNGWTFSLLDEYSGKKSAFEICSKPTVIYFSEERGKIQGSLHLMVWAVTLKTFGQPDRGQPDAYLMFQCYFYGFSDSKI